MDPNKCSPNPESQDLDAQFAAAIQRGYAAVNQSIRSSNALPVGAARELFGTFPVFLTVVQKLRELTTRQLAKAANPGQTRKTEYDIDKIIDINDNLLERALAGIEGKTVLPPLPNPDNSPAHRLPSHPQTLFEDRIDNALKVFVPRLKVKHNASEPFKLKPVTDEDEELIGNDLNIYKTREKSNEDPLMKDLIIMRNLMKYEHPYLLELETYSPPEHFLIDDGAPLKQPPPPSLTPFKFVSTKPQLDDLVTHLATVDEIAIDLEHHSLHSYHGFTCLVQISTSHGDWIIDAIELRQHLHALNESFTDPNKIKVLHGADWDVLWLQRDFGVYLVGLFDTHQASRALCLPRNSLQHLLLRYCNLHVDKSLARSDWRLRPLPENMLNYARGDTHSLLYIWKRIRRDLLEATQSTTALRSVFAASQRVAASVYRADCIERSSWQELESRASRWLDGRQRAALLALHRWRDGVARATDESPSFVAPTHTLVSLSTTLPRELQGAAAVCAPVPRLRGHLPHIHRLLLACRELPADPAPTLSSRETVPVSLLQTPTNSPHDLQAPPTPCKRSITAKILIVEPDVTVFAAPVPVGEKMARRAARLFVPPYDRYRTYRYLAQVKEMKQYKAKAAKAAVIAKEDRDLIPSPVPVHEYVPPEKRLKT